MNRLFLSALLAPFALALAACSSSSSSSDVGKNELPDVQVVRSQVARDDSPSVSDADGEALRAGNTAFAIDLYKSLGADSPNENLFFSPHSISTALAMTYAGARGTTADEMAKTLHFTLPQDRLHPAFDALDLRLANAAKDLGEGSPLPFELHLADSLFAAFDFKMQPAFLDTLAKDYGAGVRITDFASDPETARGAINGWVDNETNDKIQDLLGPGTITQDTRLVLVNAVYFKANWQNQFDAANTKPGTFHGAGGDTTAQMMALGGADVPYAAGDGWQAVELPYSRGLTFVAVVPSDMAAFEPTFTADKAQSITKALAGGYSVDVTLPKFQIKGASFSLKNTLQKLGMNAPFGAADFSGMTDESVRISDVIHQAFVSVDEKGTEAAAATAVVMVGGAAPTEVKHVAIAADKPFVFFVRDQTTGAILFLGRVSKV